jgi:hypothetical protein
MNIAEIDKIIGRDVSENVKQTDSRYEVERNLLLSELSEEGFMDAVAIHEAGHEHYYTKAGASDFKFVPPVILFRPTMTKPFKKQIACIKVGKYNTNQQEPDWLLKLAKGYAAGGECSSRLPTLCRYRGDRTDRPLLNEACHAEYRESLSKGDIDAIAESMWKDAQIEVRKELAVSDPMKAEIISRAKEVKVQLFPWTASQ